jgi:pimeloyl-ACP methyl ester carboxylesterase
MAICFHTAPSAIAAADSPRRRVVRVEQLLSPDGDRAITDTGMPACMSKAEVAVVIITIDVRSPRRLFSRRSALVTLATLIMAVGPYDRLCKQPVVFVHGLASSGATWAKRGQARPELDVQTVQPSNPGGRSGSRGELQGNPQTGGLPASTIAFGHSNSGIVSRREQVASLTGLATISAPSRGADRQSHRLGFNGIGSGTT